MGIELVDETLHLAKGHKKIINCSGPGERGEHVRPHVVESEFVFGLLSVTIRNWFKKKAL